MRLYEFASAEEQLALLRLIIDNTWSAISQQAELERRDKEAKKAKAALKPKRKGGGKLAKAKPLPIVPTPIKKPKPLAVPSQPPANPKQVQPLPSSNPTLKSTNPQLTKNTSLANPQLKANPNQTPVSPNASPAKASIGSEDAGLVGNNGNLKNNGYGDDRHSKNGMRTLKKLPRSF